jgi:hypothetical protein
LPYVIKKGGGVEGEGGRMRGGWNEMLNRMEVNEQNEQNDREKMESQY